MIFIAVCFLIGAGDLTFAQTSLNSNPDSKWQVLQPVPNGLEVGFREMTRNDRAFTRFGVLSGDDFQKVALLSRQPRAVLLDDFRATVEINSSMPGVAVALRVVLPRFIDPRTSKPLVTWIRGQQSTTSGQWQKLTVAGTSRELLQRLTQLRSELKTPRINAEGAYFNAVGLLLEVHAGKTFVDIGHVEYGPVVWTDESNGMTVSEIASAESPAVAASPQVSLRIERDRVEKNGTPVFPVIVADHGEPLSFFESLGASLIWVSDVNQTQRVKDLLDAGHLVLATPPHPEFDPADFSRPLQGLAPLQHAHPLPSAWILGTGIASDQLPHLLAWAREVRSADKHLQRPLFADMVEAEGVASRQIDAIGISQHTSGLMKPFGDARNASYSRQNTTAQLTLPWEWIQTEIAPSISAWRNQALVTPVFVEPEQILQQMFASLSAGSRGIGFWKARNLSGNDPLDRETKAAIQLAGLYLQVLEPLLVNGTLDGHLPVNTTATGIKSIRDTVRLSSTEFRYDGSPTGPDAAVIRSGGTAVILASWWDQVSHFVPGAMSSSVAEMVVSTTETSAAWQVSLTRLNGLRRNRAAGGLKLQLKDFDQHAIVLITSDLQQRRQLQNRIQEVAGQAATLWATIAELKLARVQRTVDSINQLVSAPSGISPWMQQAIDFQRQANDALRRSDFHGCEKAARSCLKALRVIQTTYWKQASQQLVTPTCSPHCASFSTLPDHWRMMTVIQSSVTRRISLLESGDFENDRALFDGEWQQLQPNQDSFQTSADVVYDPQGAGQSLRMRSWSTDRSSKAATGLMSLLISSKSIPSLSGDVIEISGKVRLGPNLRSAGRSPFLIFDDDLGPEFAMAPSLTTSWKTFRIYRQVSHDGDFKVWMGLKDTGEVYVDDLKVERVFRAATIPATAKQGNPGQTRPVGFQTPEKSSRRQGATSSGPSFP